MSLPQSHIVPSSLSLSNAQSSPVSNKTTQPSQLSLPQLPEVSDLMPLNFLSEKEKCLTDSTYNPHFIYGKKIDPILLTGWGKPQSEFLALAQHIVKVSSHLNQTEQPNQTPNPEMHETYITNFVHSYLEKKSITGFTVSFTPQQMARCMVTDTHISFKLPLKLSTEEFAGLFRHEVETHALRRWNHASHFKEDYTDHDQRRTEEGLAGLHTYLFRPHTFFFKSAVRYLTTAMALTKSFAEVREFAESLGVTSHKAVLIAMRSKRGAEDLSQPGGNTRDLVYLEGAVKVSRWLLNPNNDVRQLYIGRLTTEEAEAYDWRNYPEVLLPDFLQDDKARVVYVQDIARIYSLNEFESVGTNAGINVLTTVRAQDNFTKKIASPTIGKSTTHTLNASSRIMYEEAMRRGIHCTTFGDRETILMEKDSRSWYTRGSRTSLQSSVGKTIADYKPLTKKILEHFRLPTAKSCLIQKQQDLSTLTQLTYPVVVKPTGEKHGKGVVVGVNTVQEVEKIFNTNHAPLLVEEVLKGTEYRIICVNYQFVAAALRKPAHVIGDGSQTIEQLVAEKNAHPWRGEGHQNNLTLIIIDEEVTTYLKEQSLHSQSIPLKGKEVFLRKTANLSTGGEAWDVTEEVCEENQHLFEKIATVCDLNVIGIDVMCQSLQTPIVSQKMAGVIEVNASPGLRMHHYPVRGKVRNIAMAILDMVEKSFST